MPSLSWYLCAVSKIKFNSDEGRPTNVYIGSWLSRQPADCKETYLMTTIHSEKLNATFEGIETEGVLEWKNVLYATLSKRFDTPVVKTDYQGKVVDCRKDGPICPQIASRYDAKDGKVWSDELLCTNLRITKPKGAKGKLPVFAFLHGGANIIGSIYGDSPVPFVKQSVANGKPVLFVAIEYRLGLFGFCTNKNNQGNWGARDQWAAVEWIKHFIGEFGGDPERVTLGGQSAGAMGTSYLLHRDSMEGLNLVNQAFMSSGSVNCFPPNPVSHLNIFRDLASKELGIEDADLDEISKVDSDAMVKLQTAIGYPHGMYAYDDWFKEGIRDAVPQLKAAIVSDNGYEGVIFSKKVNPDEEVQEVLNGSDLGKHVKKLYNITDNAGVCKFYGDQMLVFPNLVIADLLRKKGTKVYRQFFDQVDPIHPEMGARHAVDVFFMWHNADMPDWAHELAKKYQTNLIKFVNEEAPWPQDEVSWIHDHKIEYGNFNPREQCSDLRNYNIDDIRELAKDLGPDLTAPGGNII